MTQSSHDNDHQQSHMTTGSQQFNVDGVVRTCGFLTINLPESGVNIQDQFL